MTDTCPSGWQRKDLFITHQTDCVIPSLVVLVASWTLFAGGLLSSIVNGLALCRLLISGEWRNVRHADFMAVLVLAIPGFPILGMIGLQFFSFRQAAIPFGAYLCLIATVLVSETPNTSLNINACNILFSLEPSAAGHLKEITTKLKPWFLVVGLMLWSSVIGMAFSPGRLVYSFLVIFTIACAAQMALQMIPDVMVYSKSLKTSESVKAYLEEFPDEQAELQKLKQIKFIGIVTLAWHIPGFGLFFYFGRFAGLIQACLLASAMPLAIFHGCVWLQKKEIAIGAESADQTRDKAHTMDLRTTACTLVAASKLMANAGVGKVSVQAVLDACTEQHVQMDTPGVQRGVSLAFLQAFVEEFHVSADEPTWQVCKRLNKPHTARLKCCYFAMLAGGRSHRNNEPWIGQQNVFVSHTWGCSFRRLVATVEAFEASHRRSPSERQGQGQGQGAAAAFYYYIDIFCLNQHEFDAPDAGLSFYDIPAGSTFETFMLDTLDGSIRQASTVLVAVDRFDDPVALSRIWCLFEMWRAIELGTPIRMHFPADEALRFARALRSQEVLVEEMVRSGVDVTKATATMPSDVQMIRKKIETSLGEGDFNTTLRTKLMAHLVHCAIHTERVALQTVLSSRVIQMRDRTHRKTGDSPQQLQGQQTSTELADTRNPMHATA